MEKITSTEIFTKEAREILTIEVISFLKKWGMWRDTVILTNGNKYSYSENSSDYYMGISNVNYEEKIDPSEYTKGILTTEDYDGEWTVEWKDFSNPEHIFEMIYEGPLYWLISNDEYEVRRNDIEPEAWDYIFANTTILNDYMFDEYGVYDLEDFFQTVKSMSLGEVSETDGEECICQGWDPLIFDTWEEYLEMGGEERGRLSPLDEFYDTYEDYLGNVEAFEIIGIDMVSKIWENMLYDAKKNILLQEDKLYLPEISGYILEEFSEIFEKHNLWFEPGFAWSLSCYRK